MEWKDPDLPKEHSFAPNSPAKKTSMAGREARATGSKTLMRRTLGADWQGPHAFC